MVGFHNVIKKIVKITALGLVLGCTMPNHKALGAEQIKPSHRALVNHIRVLQELKEYFENGTEKTHLYPHNHSIKKYLKKLFEKAQKELARELARELAEAAAAQKKKKELIR
ncbi:hypothetical protein HRU45_00375 [Candidatus Dependentiae bacterium]|nr:hypothetical protein [Candidatus Dependentiae bacterium]